MQRRCFGTAIDKLLVANRGEIACRVMKTAKKMNMQTVAVYSSADSNSMHTRMADEAYHIGPAASKESYLVMDKIIEVAKKSGAQAIHPGYGFLSENAKFSAACEANNILFVGPPPSAISAMGDKKQSKILMEAANVPCTPGYHQDDQSTATLLAAAKRIGFPVLIKATAGGGGKGMRIVQNESEFIQQLEGAQREALSSFGNPIVILEKLIMKPRHIEVQVFADKHGNCVYLHERDCSVQRRYQKVIEEAPAPGVTEEFRLAIGTAAVNAAKAVGYVGAGTVEFIVSADHQFYFMEMNTRLQVEHPITEMITRQDLVEWQLRVARGEKLPLKQQDIPRVGHAFEGRIYAENPYQGFLPGSGHLSLLQQPVPKDSSVRVETGVKQGDDVTPFYDPMIAKLVVWGSDRNEALMSFRRRLSEYKVVGLPTNVSFLDRLAAHPSFIAGDVHTGFIDQHKAILLDKPLVEADSVLGTGELTAALLSAAELMSGIQQQKHSTHSDDVYSPWSALGQREFTHGAPGHRHVALLSSSGQPQNVTVVFKSTTFPLLVNVSTTEAPDCSRSVVVKTRSHNPEYVSHPSLFGFQVTVDGMSYDADVFFNKAEVHTFAGGIHIVHTRRKNEGSDGGDKGSNKVVAPMAGKIVKLLVAVGDKVDIGQPLVVMEAMKMEHTLKAAVAGSVESVRYFLLNFLHVALLNSYPDAGRMKLWKIPGYSFS
jgi:3-methylcrotonyl-CoA carboxylase alpha subunit